MLDFLLTFRSPNAPGTCRSVCGRPFLLVVLLGLLPVALLAQSVPTGFQEYVVIGREQHVWDMLTRVQTGEGGPGFANGMDSVVSATASADNQIIIYDHWEDGYEADISNPVQTSTLTIGDGIDANGRACDFTIDPRIAPCDGTNDDTLFAGSFVNFNSDQGLGGCPAPPNDLRCSVPVNPRGSARRFDGGDRLLTSGGPISLVHPQDPLSPFIGGATEIISRQAVENARSYSIPVGEDIYGGNNSLTEAFKYVELNVVAYEDGTQVSIDSPGAGTVSFTLDQGEHYSSQGAIDENPFPALALTINAGTKISTSAPLTGLIFTGGDGTFATRFYTLLPDLLHSTDYIVTAPGDDPALQGNRPLNLYVFNPDPLNPIVVTATDSLGSSTINVPPNSQVDYFTGTGRFVPTGSTARLTSDRNFWGVSAYDSQSPANDWGHSWLSRKFITADYTVSFAPGVRNPAFESQPAQRLANDPGCTIPPAGPGVCDPLNRSPVFISATLNNTQLQIDLDNDGVFDVIDLDGDDFPDPAPLPNNNYVLNALQSLRVYDHTDYDNTGTRIVANKPVAVAYGQDTDQATGPDQIDDTGYAIYPIDQRFLDPALVIEKTVDRTSVPIAGDIATYTLSLRTFDFGLMTQLEVYDLLPPGITGADYVPGSTLVTYPNLSQSTADPAISIDPTTGRDRLDWTLTPNVLAANRELTVRYSIAIPAAPGGLPRRLTNVGHAEGRLGNSIFSPLDTAEVVQTDLTLTKSADQGLVAAGDVITFTLNVTNGGLLAETNAVVTDPIPADTSFEPGSITSSGPFAGVFDVAQNAVVWSAANFPPGGPHTLTFQVRVNPGVPPGTRIENRANYESTETPNFLSNLVEPVVAGPELAIAKNGPAVLRPGETGTFEILVDNTGAAPATNLRIVDPFPTNATVVADSMVLRRNAGPFTPLSDAADADAGTAFGDRLELLVASLGAGENLTFRFRFRVDPGTTGLFVSNQATVSADEVLPADTNLVQVPIVGDTTVTGHVFLDQDGDGTQDPGEPDLAGVDVLVLDGTGVVQRVTTDANGDYTAIVSLTCYADSLRAFAYDGSDGSVDWSSDPWIEFSTAGLADQDPSSIPLLVENDPLGVFVRSLLIEGGPAASDRGFTRRVDLSGAAGFGQGTTTLGFNFRRVSMENNDSVTLEIDYNDDGTFDQILGTAVGNGTDGAWQTANFPLDPGQLPTPSAVIRFRGTNFNFVNDNFYIDNVELCNNSVTVDVDETDPDFPAGSALSTANDPQVIDTNPGGTTAATPVGYEPPNLSFTKRSDTTDDEVVPGQTLTYTIEILNNTAVTQTGVTLSDPLPSGTNAVPGSTQILGPGPGGNTLDNFAPVAYNGSDGSLDWSATPWTEFSDQGVDGNPAAGTILVTPDPLGVNGTSLLISDGPGGTPDKGVTRQVDLGAAIAATLSFDYRRAAFEGADIVSLEIDYGLGFFPVPGGTFGQPGGGTDATWQSFSVDLDATQLPSSTVTLRFRTTGGFSNGNDLFYLDNVDITTTANVATAGNDPPNLITLGDGVSLDPFERLVVTFQVVVDPDLTPATTQITNTATVDTDQELPLQASVTDNVIFLDVDVEPNNAGFAEAGGTVTYSHEVVNTGPRADSYDITLATELGFPVELIDPDTGAVIAADLNGDGVFDGGATVNTGSLAPGEGVDYRVRVTVPPGTPLGTEQSVTLTATSAFDPQIVDFATDETTVIEMVDFGPVVLLPDHSGVVTPGGQIVYTHSLLNNTGATDTFDLTAFPSEPGFTSQIFNDSNGDGIYTPGIDVEISNSRQLADGELQTFFVVVTAPPGATPGSSDVTSLTAISQNDTDLFGAASDTTTVVAASTHDLSGGGTLLADPGDTLVFPGTIKNLEDSPDTFEFAVSPSAFFGLDGLNHPTELVVDTNADGVPDLVIATDTDGDGTWDVVDPAFDGDGDGLPDVVVGAGNELAYELRRPIDPNQGRSRDPVTLTVTSGSTGEIDRITATSLLAAATHAVVTDFRAGTEGGSVVVEWTTALEVGTVGWHLERRDADAVGHAASFRRVTPAPLPGLLTVLEGGHYRYVDRSARLGEVIEYQLVEVDQRGAERRFGPFRVDSAKRLAPPSTTATRAQDRRLADDFTARPRRVVMRSRSQSRGLKPLASDLRSSGTRKANAELTGRARVRVRGGGLAFVPAADLAAALGEDPTTIRELLASGGLRLSETPLAPAGEPGDGCPATPSPVGLFEDGFESGNLCGWSIVQGPAEVAVPVPPGPSPTGLAWLPAPGGAESSAGLYFLAASRESVYSDHNVYWIDRGRGRKMATSRPGAATPTSPGRFVDTLHVEEEHLPLTTVFDDPEADIWLWEFFVAGHPDLGVRTFDIPTPGAAPDAPATLTVHLQGQTDTADVAQDHNAVLRFGGVTVEAHFDGTAPHRVEIPVPSGRLQSGTTPLEIEARLVSGVPFDVLYLEAVDLTYTRLHRAQDDVLDLLADSPVTTVEGFSRPEITIIDTVGRRFLPERLGDVVVEPAGGGFRASFRSQAGGRYVALALDRAEVATVEADLPSSLRRSTNRGEYLVIAGAGLEPAAGRLADLRAGLGLTAKLVRLQDVYDEFSNGIPTPWAIRDFLAHARATWEIPPRLVALAGDGAFDYKNRLGTGENLLPSPLTPTPDGLFPSDHLLADLDGGDGVPEIALGRIPARTNAELEAYVDKLEAFESGRGAWRRRTVWVADNADEGGDFVVDTDGLRHRIGAGFRRDRLYIDELGVEETRHELLRSIGEGAFFVGYLGHGGPDRLAGEGLLTTADVPSLQNAGRAPIVAAFTCSMGRFDVPGFDTLSETLVLAPDGGAVALIAPSGLSFNHRALTIGDAFLRAGFDPAAGGPAGSRTDRRLGDALRLALTEYARGAEDGLHLPFVFTLLGDPAISLRP